MRMGGYNSSRPWGQGGGLAGAVRGILLALLGLAWVGSGPEAAAQQPHGNLNLGGVYFNLQAYVEAEYNDNINYSNANRQSDIILRPGFQIGSSYQVTQLNTLSLDLGISAQEYLFHSSLSSYNTFADISPSSQLAYTIIVDNFTIKVYDSFSYSVQPNNAVAYNTSSNTFVYSIAQYARFMNQIGFNVDWNLNRVVAYAGAYRYDVFPTDASFDTLRRWQYTALAGVRVIVSPSVTAGFGATFTTNTYSENFNNNSDSWYLGPTLVWQPNSTWTFNTSVGYIYYDFQNQGNVTGTNGDTSEPSTFVGSASVTQQINAKMTQGVTVSRTSNFGYVSNTLDINRAAYTYQWEFRPKWTANFWAYYEEGKASGGTVVVSSQAGATQPEDYHKWAVSPGVQYQLNQNATLYANYEYTVNNSNIPVQTFNRNRIIIGLRYQF
jgi:hypothetical protein